MRVLLDQRTPVPSGNLAAAAGRLLQSLASESLARGIQEAFSK
jgi:hypothetical protein